MNLILRAMLGFVFLMLVLALALFLSAGSLVFWQAWGYLAVFALCTMLITVYLAKNDLRLLAGRVQAGPVAETQRSQKILQSLASVFFILLFVLPGLDYRYGWSRVPPVLSLLADAIVAMGFVIVFLVFRENSYTSATVEVTQGQQVVTTGPYRIVRHPMYAGAALLVLASPIALGSWVAVPFCLPVLLVIVVRLREEEKFLSVSLAGYKEYCATVRHRLVPSVW